MKYIVSARDWDVRLSTRFGKRDRQHELTDAEVIETIVQYGRAKIEDVIIGDPSIRTLEFENDYD
jgi:hypothetical protein